MRVADAKGVRGVESVESVEERNRKGARMVK
jgi:hypothetical protein